MSHSLNPVAPPLWLQEAEHRLPQASLRRVALLSFLTVVIGLGGMLLWASLARIDAAVPATGVIIASGKRKTITVLDAGILRELLVREGDHVAAGQVLLRLDDVQIQAARNQAKVQYWAAVARAARLTAEAADRRELPIAPDLQHAADNDRPSPPH